MRHLLKISAWVLLIGGCSTTPDNFSRSSRSSSQGVAADVESSVETQRSKLQVIATAVIGVPAQYVDSTSGKTVELVVRSEYFSANGRNCRRFSEVIGVEDRNGVSCQDGRQGWIELPLTRVLR